MYISNIVWATLIGSACAIPVLEGRVDDLSTLLNLTAQAASAVDQIVSISTATKFKTTGSCTAQKLVVRKPWYVAFPASTI